MVSGIGKLLGVWLRRPLAMGMLLICGCSLSWSAGVHAAPPRAYLAATIWTGDAAPIANGVLVVRDGKVLSVGARAGVTIPKDAEVVDLGSFVLIPGIVIAETTLGERGRDDDRTLTPEFLALDGFDFFADYSRALAGGVTTVQISPGSRRLMPGQGAVVKLAGDEPAKRVLSERESLRILLGDASRNPPRIYEPPVGAVSVDRPLEPTRQQMSTSLAGAVAGIRATMRAAHEYRQATVRRSTRDNSLGALAANSEQGQRVRVTAPGSADIRAALALAREFKWNLTLVDPAVLGPFREEFGSWKSTVAGVVLNAGVRPGAIGEGSDGDGGDKRGAPPWEHARDLVGAGLKAAIRPSSDNDLEDVLFLAGLFQRGGLSQREVLRMVTTTPAEILGVHDRVGSLSAGKDADFVVLSGSPFGKQTQVKSVYINGDKAYAAKEKAHATVVTAGRIITGAGEEIVGGSVLVQGQTIRGLGRDVSMPPGTVVRRFDRAVIVPGFLDMTTGLGLGGPLTAPVGLQTSLGERLLSGDSAIAVARQGGVTTVLLATTSPAASPVLAFKLGDKPRVVREPVAIRFGVTGNLTSQAAALRSTLQTGKAYADSWARYDVAQAEYEKKKQEYDAIKAKTPAPAKPAESGAAKPAEAAKPDAAKKEEAKAPPGPVEPKPPEKPRVVDALEAYRALFSNKIPALVEAQRTDAIKLAIQVFRTEFQLRTILLGADDAFRLPALLAEKQVSVAVGPELVRTVDREQVNLAQILANQGVAFGFRSKATTGVKNLPLAIDYAVRAGLGSEDALTGLTIGPARLLSLDKQIGSLAIGKDADLVVLSGPPFESATRVLAVMIDGEWVFTSAERSKPVEEQ